MARVDTPIVGSAALATAAQGFNYAFSVTGRVLTTDELREVVNETWALGAELHIPADVAFAMQCHETDVFRFTGDVRPEQHNIGGIGTTGGGVPGVSNLSWHTAVRVFFWHLLAWTGDTILGAGSPRYALVRQAAKAKGFARTWRDLGGRWAVPGTGYGEAIERHLTAIMQQPKGAPPVAPSKPPVISNPSPNHGYPGDYRPEAIVWHITAGSGASALSWLTSPASNASANYVITEDGKVHELVNPEAGQQGAAWANGQISSPNLGNPLVKSWIDAGINPNRRTVSIEHAGQSSMGQGGSLTAAQVAATIRLTAWLCSRFGIAPDRQHIIPHAFIDSVNRANCPGFSPGEWSAWVGEIAALVGGTTPPAPPSAFQHAPGWLDPLVDTFDWQGAGIVTYRKVRAWNDQERRMYEREWDAQKGYSPWVVVQ